jgi:hypothetical protein
VEPEEALGREPEIPASRIWNSEFGILNADGAWVGKREFLMPNSKFQIEGPIASALIPTALFFSGGPPRYGVAAAADETSGEVVATCLAGVRAGSDAVGCVVVLPRM